jgi:hypothetical protein
MFLSSFMGICGLPFCILLGVGDGGGRLAEDLLGYLLRLRRYHVSRRWLDMILLLHVGYI